MKQSEKFMNYSRDVQEKIIRTLKSFDECHVERHGSEFQVCTGWCLKAVYGDEEVLDTFKKEEIFTESEMILNYMEAFHEYHPSYKGKRNYKMINEVEKNWNAKFDFDSEGNIIRIA